MTTAPTTNTLQALRLYRVSTSAGYWLGAPEDLARSVGDLALGASGVISLTVVSDPALDGPALAWSIGDEDDNGVLVDLAWLPVCLHDDATEKLTSLAHLVASLASCDVEVMS
jgi:hypothetical protein